MPNIHELELKLTAAATAEKALLAGTAARRRLYSAMDAYLRELASGGEVHWEMTARYAVISMNGRKLKIRIADHPREKRFDNFDFDFRIDLPLEEQLASLKSRIHELRGR